MRKEGDKRVLLIDCENCDHSSTLMDENCRKNIMDILMKEAEIGRMVLHHPFVKVFDGNALEFLKNLASFVEDVNSFDIGEGEGKCRECLEERKKRIGDIASIASRDPILAYIRIKEEIKEQEKGIKKKPVILGDERRKDCNSCIRHYLNNLREIIEKSHLETKIDEKRDSESHYMYDLQPYIRPIFFDTYIHLSPPPDAIFIKKYEIEREGGSGLDISLYSLSTRPEKMYFAIPPEYNLSPEELKLLQKVKERMARHRPRDTSFMEPETSREYFMKFARDAIKKIAEEEEMHVEMEKVEMLSDIFAKYTAGLGLLEDLLMDKNIQDIYINAPVSNNPLHIVWNGEEYTSNIYFSEQDVEALSSRFRSLSGRPFSEAAPILDMGLEKYGSRVAAISAPLTPKGVAFAIRRHSMTPWTLPKLVSYKMLSPKAAALLSFLVDGQATILIAGSRGAGKTSLLSSLILEIPQRYRILTLEDTPELPIDTLQSLGYKIQSLITQPITAGEGGGGVAPETALRTALRLGESVLILGEVRGEETKVLFEAMRVGAAGNVVLGTIHGATTRDVFERIVYDIGVTATSFKATDAVVVAAPIRIGGGMEKRRRVIQISEVSKRWGKEADPDKIFADMMVYNAERDAMEATDLLDMGQSEVIGRIAREWGITIEKAIENISLRAKIREEMVKYGKNNPALLEASVVRDANNAFWMLIEESKEEHGSPDYKYVEKKWMKWYRDYVKKI